MDGLSPARQQAGVASAVVIAATRGRWTWFFIFAVLHAAIWTILPFTLYPNLPLDLVEALTYGPEWQLGYDKLPPLPWWLVEIAHRSFGSDVAYYLLGQFGVLAAFAGVWASMLRIAGPAAALAAILIIDGLHYFNFTAPKFNHDVIQLPFWALAGLSFHAALRTGRPAHWIVLGAAVGIALWAKYFVVILGLPLALFVLVDARARRCLATPGPYIAAAVALAVMAPHLIWLIENDFVPLNYVAARSTPRGGFLNSLIAPASFVAGQLLWLLPALIISLPLFQRPYDPQATEADAYDRRILALLAFGPAATVIAASAVSGRGLVAMWGYPLWLYLGPWIVVTASAQINRTCLRRLTGNWGAVTAIYVVAFIADYAILPHYDHRYRAVLFPGDRLADEISTRFRAATGRPLAYVVSSMWLGGNIGHYGAEHPRNLIDGDPRRAPWIDLDDLAATGAAVVWLGNERNILPPAAYADVAGRAEVQTPFTLPMRRGKGEIAIRWAIIPPQH